MVRLVAATAPGYCQVGDLTLTLQPTSVMLTVLQPPSVMSTVLQPTSVMLRYSLLLLC